MFILLSMLLSCIVFYTLVSFMLSHALLLVPAFLIRLSIRRGSYDNHEVYADMN